MKLIVGLGNPGEKYQKTRHNIGFVVIDKLVENLNFATADFKDSKQAKANYLKVNYNNQDIEFLKPMDFMNNSGFSVAYAIKNHDLNPKQDLIVIHDDKDIPLGDIKIQKDKSDAGHNGIKSIINHLKTQNFTRVRIGVAPENPKKIGDTANFVLKKFGLFEKKKINTAVEKAVAEIIKLI